MFKILQLGYFALLIILWALLLAKCPNRFFSASEKDLELTALKILSKNLRWILWLICLPNIQPPQTRELSERLFLIWTHNVSFQGMSPTSTSRGTRLSSSTFRRVTSTLPPWVSDKAGLSSINYMHITNIHRHRITTNNLYILYVLYQLEELTT